MSAALIAGAWVLVEIVLEGDRTAVKVGDGTADWTPSHEITPIRMGRAVACPASRRTWHQP
jgi:hypothetical protein